MAATRTGVRAVVATDLKELHLPWPTCHDSVEQQFELVSLEWLGRRDDGEMRPNEEGRRGLRGLREIWYTYVCARVRDGRLNLRYCE